MKKLLGVACLLFVLPASGIGGEPGRIAGRVTLEKNQKRPVVVFLLGLPNPAPGAPRGRPVLDEKGKVFIPHILPVVVGSTVEFRNDDPFRHNIFSPDGERYNLGTWIGTAVKTYTFKKAGVYRQLCNIHPEMLAYIVVLDTPYFAMTDGDGDFEIPALPEGRYTAKVWGEKLTPSQLAHTFAVQITPGKITHVDIDLRQ